MRRGVRGQSLTEFALILPLFLLLTVGLLDAGRAIYAYNTVANSARTAARVAIVDQDPTVVEDAAIESATGLDLTASNVTFTTCPVQGCLISVKVEYDFFPVTPIVGQVFNPVIESTAVMPIEVSNP